MENYPIKETTEIWKGEEAAMKGLINVMSRVSSKADIVGDSNAPSFSMGVEQIKEGYINFKKRGFIIRFITEITKENLHYCKELMDYVVLRHLDLVKGNMAISESEYVATANLYEEAKPVSQTIYSNTKTILEQHQYFFETLWDKAVPAEQRIKEIEEGIEPANTRILQNSQDIFEASRDFYKKSNQIKFCFPIEGIKLIYRDFFNFHQEILLQYKQGKHKGIRLITSINNKKDVELIKGYFDKGIEVRHINDLLTNRFALSDKSFLFTIGSVEKGEMVTNVLSSNDKLYLDHYNAVFENLWKKGIDIQDRINNIEEGYNFDIETISNPKESLKFTKELLQTVTKEILILLPSYKTFCRLEKSIGINGFEELANQDIKVKVLIPMKIELHDKINGIRETYPKIEFRAIQSNMDSFIGINIIDKERVLITEIKDDSKINYSDSVGMTIYIEGGTAAISYTTIFNSLWKQTELYERLEKAFERIQKHEKMQRDFINIAAHELRTPIQPILGFTDHLRNKIEDKEQLEFLDIINKNTKKLKKLSDDILEVSKIENNLLNLHKERFNIKELILQIKSNYEREAEEKNIEFEFADNNNDSFIYADKEKISEVVSNLINNSIKFMIDKEKGSGKISMLVKKRVKNKDIKSINHGDKIYNNNYMIVITVKDNGKGIDPEIYPRLFTKFASKSFQGTGLGLYISKNIVEAHGGKIWAKNNEEEKGATFSFSLPLINDKNDVII